MRVPWIRGSPTKKAKKGTFASLARPKDGFLDFGRLGLVLGPLIQGRMRAGLSGTHVQLNGKCRKIVFSSMRCSKFSGLFIIDSIKTIYFYLWDCIRLEQTKPSTQLIHFIWGLPEICLVGCSISLKISQNQEFLYEKDGLFTFSIP